MELHWQSRASVHLKQCVLKSSWNVLLLEGDKAALQKKFSFLFPLIDAVSESAVLTTWSVKTLL